MPWTDFSYRGRSQLWQASALLVQCWGTHSLRPHQWISVTTLMVMLTQRLGTPATPCQVHKNKIISHITHITHVLVPAHKRTLTLFTSTFQLLQVHCQVCLTSLTFGGRVGGVVNTRRFLAAAWPPHHPSTRRWTAWAASNAASWIHAWTCCRNSSTGTTSCMSGVIRWSTVCQPEIGSFTWQWMIHNWWMLWYFWTYHHSEWEQLSHVYLSIHSYHALSLCSCKLVQSVSWALMGKWIQDHGTNDNRLLCTWLKSFSSS